MAQGRGYKSQLCIDFESQFKTDPAVKKGKIVPINTWDVKATKNLTSPGTITGTRNPVDPIAGFVAVSGNAGIPVDYVAFGWWLMAMFGKPTTTGTGPYVHTFKLGDEQPSLVAEKKEVAGGTSYYTKQNGVKVASMDLNVGGDGELVANLSVVGADESLPGTTAYDSEATAIAFARAQQGHASIKEGDAEIGIARECTLRVNLGLDTSQYCIGGGGVLGDIPEGIVSVEGNMNALFVDLDLATKSHNLAKSSLEIRFEDGDYSLVFKIPELRFKRSGRAINGPAGILQPCDWVGFLDDDAGKSVIQVELTNNQATYE